ncbi:MAG TPA: hypothetical protein VF701_07740 [Thermoanaerobaculia bacterium]
MGSVVRAAIILALVISIWLTLPGLIRTIRQAADLRRLDVHARRAHILGPLYESIRALDRQLPPGEPVALIFRQPADADLGIYVNYYLYPRPTKHYFGVDAYQQDPRRPAAIGWIDRESAWEVRLLSRQQLAEEASR